MSVLTEGQTLLEREVTAAFCTVCGAEGVRRVFDLPVLDGPFGNEVEFRRRPFFRCDSCGFIEAGLYDPNRYQRYYESLSSAYHSDHDTDKSRYDFILDLFPKHGVRRALDFGSGTGTFLSALPASVEKFAVELSVDGARRAQLAGTCVLTWNELMNPELQGSFDLVTAIDVVEHLADLSSFRNSVASLLAEDGLFVLLTGNLDSAPAKTLGRYWYYLHYGEHISFLSERSLRVWLRPDFEVVTVSQVTHHPVPLTAWMRAVASFGVKWTLTKLGLADRFRVFPTMISVSDHVLVSARRRARTVRNNAT